MIAVAQRGSSGGRDVGHYRKPIREPEHPEGDLATLTASRQPLLNVQDRAMRRCDDAIAG